jgi:hypothetical protein
MLGHRRRIKRAEVDGSHAGQPQQLGDYRPQRVPAMQVIGTVSGHDGQPFPVQHPAQERDQITGRPVRPVQVLQDQQHRARLGKLSEHAEHRAEQLLLR